VHVWDGGGRFAVTVVMPRREIFRLGSGDETSRRKSRRERQSRSLPVEFPNLPRYRRRPPSPYLSISVSLSQPVAPIMPPSKKKGKVVAGQRDRKLDQAFRSTVRSALKGIPADEWQAYVPPGLLSREVMEAAFDAYQQVRREGAVDG